MPPLAGRVVDQAGMFGGQTAQVEAAILGTGTNDRRADGHPHRADARGRRAEIVQHARGRAWKIGHKGKDNGALLVIVGDSHHIRFDIGYGWEG